MTKHGASHAAAVLVCMVASDLFADIIRKYVPFIYDAVNKVSSFLVDLLSIQYAPKYFSFIIYATILALIWGVAFSLVHND